MNTILRPARASILLLLGCLYLPAHAAAAEAPTMVTEDAASIPVVDISGNWRISSRVGADGPQITVHCTLEQDGADLSGSCTPEMENAQPSALSGSVIPDRAEWGYDVVFNGNPGRVDFVATSLEADALAGTLTLSGMDAPFTAVKE